jgi:hypothetical protein
VPSDTGSIVGVEWDFDGAGAFPVKEQLEPAETLVVERTWCYTEPGTYFPVVRVVTNRRGDPTSPYGRLQNLARVRVVVG